MQVFVDGAKYADYVGVKQLPVGTQITLSSPGMHRIGVQSYDTNKSALVKSVIYVINP
jgi:hypothetical protein